MKKSFIISSLTALAAFCLCATAQAQGPVVVSDKDDYSPGETALFQAAGFDPNELLDFSIAIQDENGGWLPDIAWADIPADASGGAEVDYVVPETWADRTLQLTVMGLTSGLMAQTTFTDHNPGPTYTGTGWSISHDASNNISVSVNVSCTANCTGHTVTGVQAQVANLGQIALSDVGGGTWSGSSPGVCGTPYTFNHIQVDTTSVSGNNHNDTVQAPTPKPTTTTDPCPTPTPEPTGTPTATPTPTPCQNHAPIIVTANSDVDLGQVVGCLGTGEGFGQTFPVSWAVVAAPSPAPANEKIVQATFTRPSPLTPVVVDVASVTDVDGDPITVTLSNETTSVTISGPGNGSAFFVVDIGAHDDQDCNNTAVPETGGGTASADIVYHVHYLPPLYDMATTKVKQGSGVPVKMQLTDCSGTPITPNSIPGDTPTIAVSYLSGVVPSGPADVDDAGNSNGDTLFFRWSTDDLFWIFNLKTNSSYAVGATYEVQPSTVDNSAKISIK